MKKSRLDLLLVEQGLAETRQKAQAMIMTGAVLVNDVPITKAGTSVSTDVALRIKGNPLPYVSRGGVKLAGALDHFGFTVAGLTVLDIGISTGGFTDCLLQRGAAHVFGVDVGRGQVAWKLQQDPRVTLFEGENIRHFDVALLPAPVDLVVADVSFISLNLVLPVVAQALAPGGIALPMVKPQFEVGREGIGKKGVVRDESLRQHAVDKVALAARTEGLEVLGQVPSPLPGPEGNVEFFLHLRKPPLLGC
jgi:23S rRNA (cytidine1920-2'-O)/16S rRNA (cytidine1409-2'-O)-methyltransferase